MSSAGESRIQWPDDEAVGGSRLEILRDYVHSQGYFEHIEQTVDGWSAMVGDITREPVLLAHLKDPACGSEEALARRMRHIKQADTAERAMLKAFLSWHSFKLAQSVDRAAQTGL